MKNLNLLRWLPVAGSVALMVLIAIVSAMTVGELKQATHWRKHTFQVILDAQAYEDKLVDAQSRIQHYTEAGKPNLLIEYESDTNAELQEFNKLTALTGDNPEQQRRLKDLDAAVKAVFDYDNRVVGVYARQGSGAALKMEEAPEDVDDVDAAVQDIEKFKGAEEKLLETRDATEQVDYHRAAASCLCDNPTCFRFTIKRSPMDFISSG
jgi:methyl-accepting chemotaxis protein